MDKNTNDSQLVPDSAVASDEIDLVDLGVALARRWKLIVGITLAFIALGVLFALLKQPAYRYMATVQLATYITPNGQTVHLIPPPNGGNNFEQWGDG